MSLKIISSNIRFENPKDGKHNWPYRLPVLKKSLLGYLPDIIGTQEGRRPQLLELERSLNLDILDGHRDWIEERMYPSLFIKRDKFEVKDSGDIWLSETPTIAGSKSFESSFPRLATWANLFDKNLKKEILICNVHLDHVLASTRVEQIKVLINELTNIKKDIPLILIGDFNDSPKSEVQDLALKGLNLLDPWKIHKNDELSSHHNFDGNTSEGFRIDWLLHTSDLTCDEIEFDTSSENNIFPSDHFPLKAKISFN